LREQYIKTRKEVGLLNDSASDEFFNKIVAGEARTVAAAKKTLKAFNLLRAGATAVAQNIQGAFDNLGNSILAQKRKAADFLRSIEDIIRKGKVNAELEKAFTKLDKDAAKRKKAISKILDKQIAQLRERNYLESAEKLEDKKQDRLDAVDAEVAANKARLEAQSLNNQAIKQRQELLDLAKEYNTAILLIESKRQRGFYEGEGGEAALTKDLAGLKILEDALVEGTEKLDSFATSYANVTDRDKSTTFEFEVVTDDAKREMARLAVDTRAIVEGMLNENREQINRYGKDLENAVEKTGSAIQATVNAAEQGLIAATARTLGTETKVIQALVKVYETATDDIKGSYLELQAELNNQGIDLSTEKIEKAVDRLRPYFKSRGISIPAIVEIVKQQPKVPDEVTKDVKIPATMEAKEVVIPENTPVPDAEGKIKITGIRQDSPNEFSQDYSVNVNADIKQARDEIPEADKPVVEVETEYKTFDQRQLEKQQQEYRNRAKNFEFEAKPSDDLGSNTQTALFDEGPFEVELDGVLVSLDSSNVSIPLGGVRAATGGYIRGKGTGTSDSIGAWLSNGEYVMDAKTTRFFGPAFFAALQKWRAICLHHLGRQ
jgi:hypothetical protein